MQKIYIKKSAPLNGAVKIPGAKNSVLKLMAASILAEKECIIENVPALLDVETMKELLISLGLKIEHDKNIGIMWITPAKKLKFEASYELVEKMRASITVLGPLIAKVGRARLSMPGGCPIGMRPINLHIKGLKALGAKVNPEFGFIDVTADDGLKGAEIYLDFPSVGATENIMLAATKADGLTVIQNAAKEPEIIDLANFLNELGANIKGAGTDTIKVLGVKNLGGTRHQTIPDRMITITYMLAAVITKGEVTVKGVVPSHVRAVTAKLREMEINIVEGDDWITVKGLNRRLNSTNVTTLPYPGVPTDIQAPFMALLTLCEGTSMLHETVYDNRFLHVPELNRMGANIKIEGSTAVVQGVPMLTGAPVKATDLRCGAALVLAGLAAEGETEIDSIYHIDRGYPQIEADLRALGADIRRSEPQNK